MHGGSSVKMLTYRGNYVTQIKLDSFFMHWHTYSVSPWLNKVK